MCMKRYRTWERRKMGSKLFMGLFLLCCGQTLTAQDSIEPMPPVLEDSVTMAEPLPMGNWVDYMEEGYYDTIPRIDQIPQVDTAVYTELIKRYQDPEYDYDRANPNQIGLFAKIWDRLARLLENLFPARQYFQFADLVYKVLAVAALVLFVWIIYRALFSGKRLFAKDKQEEELPDEVKFVEKNLLEVDLQSYIEKAQKDGDFALSIRYLNLLNIQLLAKRELIRWKYTKTHVELIEDIEEEELRRDFSRNVDIYNRVWYGNMVIDKARYEEYASYFLTFQSRWR